MTNPTDRQLLVLGFHKIGEPPPGTWTTWNYLPEATFVGFLELVGEEGWSVIDMAATLAGLTDPSHLPSRSVLLTFDDGYRSMLTVAQPLLERFAYPSVLFVPTDYVGGTNTWDAGNEPDEPLCTWAELRELRDRGVSIQSHAASHRTFSDLTPDELVEELERSKTGLEEEVDRTVDVLAYPFGDPGPEVERTEATLRDVGYRAACLFRGDVMGLPFEAPFRLERLPVGTDTNLRRRLVEPA